MTMRRTGRRHRIDKGIAWAGLALMLSHPAAAGLTTTTTRPVVERRNVLLIIGDDMGVAQFDRYVDYYNDATSTITQDDMAGVDPPVTDNINNLAANGVTFMNVWSSPLCSATRAGIYTGLYGNHNTIKGALDNDDEGLVPSRSTTIAEILMDASYQSGLFGKWHLGTYSPYDHGWRMFMGSKTGSLDDYFTWTKTVDGVETAVTPFGSMLARITGEVEYDGDDEDYATFVNVDDTLDWIGKRTGRWMATVAFNAAHTVGARASATLVGQGPRGSRGCEASASVDEAQIYKDIITCMDVQIGYLLSHMNQSTLANTTVIFVGDNGPEPKVADFSRFEDDGKATVYEGGVAVPLIIADGANLAGTTSLSTAPGRVRFVGRRSFALVQTVDLFKTIAAIAGANGASGSDSYSLVPVLEATSGSGRTYSFTESEDDEQVAVRDLNYKLISFSDGSCELYKLSEDRWENNELLGGGSTAYDSIVTNLLAQIKALSGLDRTCP
jgi:arylsulfatase A-like enzyme